MHCDAARLEAPSPRCAACWPRSGLLANTEPATVGRLRRVHRAGRAALPAAPRHLRRRRGRPRDLHRADRRPLAPGRPGAGPLRRPADAPATTSAPCRPSCSSSATTSIGPTASSAPPPPRACAPSSATTAWPPTASAGPRRCARCASCSGGWSAGARSCCARWPASPTSGPSLLGKRIVIDPGHGGEDTGRGRTTGVTEADLVWDLATRLEGRLSALGVQHRG